MWKHLCAILANAKPFLLHIICDDKNEIRDLVGTNLSSL